VEGLAHAGLLLGERDEAGPVLARIGVREVGPAGDRFVVGGVDQVLQVPVLDGA
jgi:hypothetical protein